MKKVLFLLLFLIVNSVSAHNPLLSLFQELCEVRKTNLSVLAKLPQDRPLANSLHMITEEDLANLKSSVDRLEKLKDGLSVRDLETYEALNYQINQCVNYIEEEQEEGLCPAEVEASRFFVTKAWTKGLEQGLLPIE